MRRTGRRASPRPPQAAAEDAAAEQVRLDAAGLDTLARIAADAVSVTPFFWSSVLGAPWTWLPPHGEFSEFGIVDPWQPVRTSRFLLGALMPSIPRSAPSLVPPPARPLFHKPTVILQRPDHYGSYTSFPDEAWFFVNGILTDDAVAQLNAAYLAHLFHRPITIVQNSTCSWSLDLLECALGKQWTRTTEAARKVFPAVHAALTSGKTRVVLIAHSQGTIITAVVLHLLASMLDQAELAEAAYAGPVFVVPEDFEILREDFAPLTLSQMRKLEVYCFANCANVMRQVRPAAVGERPVPWIESFGNEYDIVARLGMLAPRAEHWGIVIDGPRYVRDGAWGHLLNVHYLARIEAEQKLRHRKGGTGGSGTYRLLDPDWWPHATPRLFDYINGGSPQD